jgi:hypothetical protein
MLVLVPKTEPRMIAAISKILNKQIGMANLFLRYQGRLVNVMKILHKKKIKLGSQEVKLTQFLGKDVHLNIEIL